MFSFDFYLFLFFNYELLVVFCFFFFLLFLFLAENSQLSSSLLSLSSDARSLFSRHLASRDQASLDLSLYLQRSISLSKKVLFSFFFSSSDLLLSLQFVSKKFSFSLLTLHVRSYLDVISSRSLYLSFHIKLYLTHHLFFQSRSLVPVLTLYRLL